MRQKNSCWLLQHDSSNPTAVAIIDQVTGETICVTPKDIEDVKTILLAPLLEQAMESIMVAIEQIANDPMNIMTNSTARHISAMVDLTRAVRNSDKQIHDHLKQLF